MFVDGKKVYSKYKKEYNVHKKGYVILGPPGAGKTYFCKHQVVGKKDWMDTDDIFKDLGVKWHQNKNNKVDFKLNYLRADYMLEQSRALGFRIIGAL
jgi:predicted kinase